MEKVLRWGSRLELVWKPILAFHRRRLQYIDWLEERFDPAAFLEDAEGVGVAPRNYRERLSITRGNAYLELRNPQAKAEELEAAFSGALELLSPSGARIDEYRGHWSLPMTAQYDTVRSAFVRQLLPRPLLQSGVELLDGAYLIEASLDRGEMMFEYGIVDADELEQRVRKPDDNRMGSGLPPPVLLNGYKYPATSLYVDVSWRPSGGVPLASAGEVIATWSGLEKKITNLVRDLAGSLQ